MKKLNKTLSVILVAIMVFSSAPLFGIDLFSVETQAASEVYTQSIRFMERFTQKTTVPSDYVGIYNATDLNNIRNNTSGKYILMSDIDLSSISSWNSFSANGMTLDGNGHKIKNLKSTSKGLISTASGSTVIKNLGIENININSTGNEVGGIVGRAKSVTITNCYVTGSISAKYDVGGICGNYDSDSTAVLTSCYNLADISASSSYAGGIFGEIDTLQFETITITKCYNGGNVTAASSYAGGIVGYSSGYGDQVKIFTEQCCNTGNIYAKQYAGGITGYETGVFGWMRIVDCFNTGSVSGESYVGGIVGASCKTIMSSYNIGSVSGSKNVDAMVGLTTLTVWDNPRNCSLYNCYYLNTMNSTTNATKLSKEAFRNTSSFQPSNSNYPFDFNSIWVIDANYNDYFPFLRCCDNIKWMFKSESLNEPKSIDNFNEFIIYAYATNTEDCFVAAEGAEISVYSGPSLLFTKMADSSGKVSFTTKEFLDRGLTKEQILQCTVSGHFRIGDELYLCSEAVYPDGTWNGKTIATMIEYDQFNLFLDEPRMVIDISVGYVGKNDKEKEKRYKKIKTMLEGYSQKLAEMTNGHALINSFSLAAYSSDIALSNATHDIYMFDDPSNTINLDVETASTYSHFHNSGTDYSGFPHNGFIVFKYGNSVFSDKTLCHESGHLLFGFYDEYCSGFGYDRDLNGNGTIEKNEKNAGKWTNRGGKTERPTFDGIKAPDNFGVMDYQHDGLIELSTPASYAYLANKNYDSNHPEWYTLHYYNYQLSTENSLAAYLMGLVRGTGFTARYTLSNGMTQKAKYDYSKVEVDSYIAHSEGLLINDSDPIVATDSILFSYDEQYHILTITGKLSNVQAQLEDKNGIQVFQPTYDGEMFTIRIPINSDYGCLEIVSIDQDLQEKKEYYNIIKNESGIFVNYSDNLYNDGYYSVTNTIQVLYLNDDISEYELSKKLSIDTNCDLTSATWFDIDNNIFSPIQTYRTSDINNEYTLSCSINSIGKYSLMAKPASEEQGMTLSDFSVRQDTEGDGILYLSFDDSSENNEYYTIFVSKNSITEFDSEDVFSFTTTSNNDIVIYVDNEATYYFTILARSSDGSYEICNNIVTYTYQNNDDDNDGIPNYWFEIYNQLKDIENVANVDSDYDGLTNLQEYQLGTNPLSSDTDGDNVPDNIEIKYSLDPTNAVTNGTTNDYIVVYGKPEVSVQKVSFDDNNLTFNVVNNSDGKAMRSVISVEADGAMVALWTVNIGANSELTFDVPLESVQNCHNLIITCDEGQITHDTNYNNNTFIYAPAETIAFDAPSYTVVKGSTISPALTVTPQDSNDIIAWKIDGTAATIDSITGLVTAKKIGTATVTVNTLDGKTATCEIFCVAFEGAEYSEFDSVLIENNTQVAITGYIGSDTDIVIPETIGGLPVTTINASAFNGRNFNSVYLHDGITTISDTAFGTVTGLQSFTVDPNNTAYVSENGVLYSKDFSKLVKFPVGKEINSYSVNENTREISSYAFYGSSVSELSLDNELTTIGSSAFENCKSLSSITIPENVNTIGTKSFANCDALKTVNYNSKAASSTGNIISVLWSNATIFANSPVERIIIGQNVESIPGFVFARMSTVKTVDFSSASNLRSIGTYAFVNDSSIESVSLPEGLTSLGTYAFSGCSGISSLVLPESLTSIGNYAFQSCTQIGNLTIHYNVESIGENTFKNCSSLKIICYNNSAAYNNAVANSIPYEIIAVPATGISGNDISVIKGETTELSYNIEPWYSSENVSFESNKTNIATVDGNTLSALKCGYTIITLTTDSGITNTFRVNVVGTENAEPVDFDYTVSSDKTSITVNDYTGESKTATIPDTIAGIPVTTVSSSFAATGLENLTIGKNVATIYVNSFGSAKTLKNISVESNNTAYADIDGVLTSKDKTTLMRYPMGRNDISYTVPETITTINAYAFSNTKIQEIDFDDAEITSIGWFAFNGSGLRVVTIPESVSTIGSAAFGGCNSLTTVFYNATNASYSKFILSSASVCPSSIETFIIADGVKTIPEKLFSNSNISELYLPNSIESIADSAFGDIDNLTIQAYKNNEFASQYAESHGFTLEIVTCGNCQFTEWAIIEAPSCTLSGTKISTCDICGAQETKPVSASGHKFGSWTKLDDNQHQRICENDSSHVEKEPHSWNGGTVTKAATCTEAGMRTFTCTVCGAKKTESIKATGHNYGAWKIVKAPTCTSEGVEQRVCSNDTKHVETRPIAKSAHADNDGDGYCDKCHTNLDSGGETHESNCVCGKYHTGPFAGIIKFFHIIVYFFKNLFGKN